MRVHVHTKFCFLCVLALLFHQCNRCHGDGQGGHPHTDHTHSDLQILEAPYARGTTLSPDAKSPKGPTLEEEQRFYIQQLFRRYGQKDRLDFQGFQSMLFSLGLGEVKLLDGDHEQLGHDHVSHLDLVDMKEGRSHEADGHGHGRGHGHAPRKPGVRRPHAEQVPTSCTQRTAGAGPAERKRDGERGHDRTKVEDGDQRNSDGHVQDTHDHDKEHTHGQVEVTSDQKDHGGHDHGGHDHSSHDHSGHDHGGHDHSSHDHSGHDHGGHDHGGHDHSGHDHSSHDHGGHDHGGHDHDHGGHDHSSHDHSGHDHGGHDHSSHDHSSHDHGAHDNAGHDHSSHDHGAHDHGGHDHGAHDNAGHDHSSHDHAAHDHGGHDHGAQDHAAHDHAGHDHAAHDHGGHDHAHGDDHNHVPESQTVTDIAASPRPSPGHQAALASPSTTESRPETPGKPARGKRGRSRTPSPLAPASRKAKREATGGLADPPTAPVPVLSGHLGLSHQHEECLNLTQLLAYYGLTPNSLISPSQFTYLCPALLYQIDSRVCIRHYEMDVQQEAMETGSSGWVWLWGFVSISIISLLSLLGVVLVPILKQSYFKFLLTFLVALAVGTLTGDALLHLLPHSQEPHDHGAHGATEEVDLITKFDGVWKGLTALTGIYFLFIIEHCIGMFKHYRDHRGRKKANEEGKIGRKLSDHKLNRRSDAEWLHLKPLGEDADGTAVSCDNGHNDTQLSELRPPDSPTNKTPLAPPRGEETGGEAKHHGHAHSENCHSDQEMKDAGIASIAWMVIMGDGMHNFSDGLAIGAAFSANLTGGISTSVAVFCHELPHELGDFAVLLKAGMSVKQAIYYNMLSALMAYFGMAIGTAVGQYTHNLTSWIFAITAGMFLYVALVDMLPEMLHGDSEEHKRCQLGHFVLQNMGMLTGFAIMLLIAIFEDRIIINFGF
ncbi:zinc transporter ZIP10 isoform X2 [Pseudoliparis swirei]|nr:zinc transporter ZIP10 isoform X2 [Pseudoliparis swirei]XP_056289112.1 zinc transporter ZIP10 isoform X2 [Pseudoliparis swirei]XP_056289122.1 zinc transporter ZIP10 isoform X2 [Pseudoliparis swirei]XP_056289128.1 zinc transporter ZIP10 isoform X2 [Pseudoliparis swirei]XP_056289136.1 zinc transporter ZIP10 isoform X2 [Pseudoliparis swirei]